MDTDVNTALANEVPGPKKTWGQTREATVPVTRKSYCSIILPITTPRVRNPKLGFA